MQPVHLRRKFSSSLELCKFYADLLAHDDRLKELWTVVELVMVLPHGNAAAEGGFYCTMLC